MSPDSPTKGFLGSTGDTSYKISIETETGEKVLCRYNRKNNVETVEVDAPYEVIHKSGKSAHCRYEEAYGGGVRLLLESEGSMRPQAISAAAASLEPEGSAIISVPEDGHHKGNIVFADSSKRFHDKRGIFPSNIRQALEAMGDCKALGIKPYISTYRPNNACDEGELPLTYHYSRDLGKPVVEPSIVRQEETVQDTVSCVYRPSDNGDHLEIKVPITCSYNDRLEMNPLEAYKYADSDLTIIPTEDPQATFRTVTEGLSYDAFRTWNDPYNIPVSVMSKNGITLNQGKLKETFSQLPKQIPETIANTGNCSSVNVYNFSPLPNGTVDRSGYKPGRIMLSFLFDTKFDSDDDDGAST